MRRAGRKDLRRNAGSRSEHRRVFVSSEGYKTEVQYMRELLRQSEILGLHGRVEVVILNRYETDSGLSHPDQVIGMTADYMEFLSSDRCSVGLFLSKVLDSAGNPGRAGVRELSRDEGFRSLCTDGYVADMERARVYAASFMFERGFPIDPVFEDQFYSKDSDVVCVIIDRDTDDGRTPERYADYKRSCENNGFRLFVTNPKFEFWILMHQEDDGPLASISDSRNPSAATDRVMGSRGMDKDHLDFERIVGNLSLAMENAKGFTFTAEELENRVGTNMPGLIHLLEGDVTRSMQCSGEIVLG